MLAEKIETLTIPENTILETSQRLFSTSDLALLVLRQAFFENWLKLGRKVSFRSRDNARACAAYSRMSYRQFEGINARQAWANWRTIPRNLSELLPLVPLRAIDLCSGTGDSTRVLAYYLPEGSSILGLEFNPLFVAVAEHRVYRHQSGREVNVQFHRQSVLETFRETSGEQISSASIDVVNCVGAVGHHFVARQTRLLAKEIGRVLRPLGLALVDSGTAGTRRHELLEIFRNEGFEPIRSARSCFLDPYEQVCFRKLAPWRRAS